MDIDNSLEAKMRKHLKRITSMISHKAQTKVKEMTLWITWKLIMMPDLSWTTTNKTALMKVLSKSFLWMQGLKLIGNSNRRSDAESK